jgi:hypothetical protein
MRLLLVFYNVWSPVLVGLLGVLGALVRSWTGLPAYRTRHRAFRLCGAGPWRSAVWVLRSAR